MSRPISDPVFDIGRDLQRAYDEGYKQGRYDEKVETETSLPNGEPTHAVRSNTISRRDAIDAIVAWTVEDRPDVEMPTDLIDRITGLPSAQPEIKTDGDTISRQAAIDEIVNTPTDVYSHDGIVSVLDGAAFRQNEIVDIINALPSAQPKRKRGEWILECDAEGEGDNLYRCSECGCNYSCQEYDIPNFCPNCGSYNGGESE